MRSFYLEAFSINDFTFSGAHVFSSSNGLNLLLGGQGNIIILSNELMNSLIVRRPSEELCFKLVQHYLGNVAGRKQTDSICKIKPTFFVLDLTKKCNLDCIYCFRDLSVNYSTDNETLGEIINYIIAYCKKENLQKIRVQPWGGEPLLEIDKIEFISKMFEKAHINANLDLQTNATLIDDALAQRLYNLKAQIGISIDGNKYCQDIHRTYIDGRGSFLQVVEGISHLQNYYIGNLGGISVITKYNYQHIKDILKCFIFDIGLRQVKFNIVRDNCHARGTNIGLNSRQVQEFINMLFDGILTYNQMPIRFIEGNISARLDNLLFRSEKNCCLSHGCTGGKSIISIDYKGDIFPCELIDFPEHRLGNIYTNQDLMALIEEAEKTKDFFRVKEADKCHGCPWHYYCRGGCNSRMYYLGSNPEIDETECTINCTLYPKLVELILTNYELAYFLI